MTVKVVRITAGELMRLAHCYSDKVLEDLFAEKGIDVNRPFIKYFDFSGTNLMVEQEVDDGEDGSGLENDDG